MKLICKMSIRRINEIFGNFNYSTFFLISQPFVIVNIKTLEWSHKTCVYLLLCPAWTLHWLDNQPAIVLFNCTSVPELIFELTAIDQRWLTSTDIPIKFYSDRSFWYKFIKLSDIKYCIGIIWCLPFEEVFAFTSIEEMRICDIYVFRVNLIMCVVSSCP